MQTNPTPSFSHRPPGEAQPGQVPGPGQHGGGADQAQQPGGGHQGLPEAAHPVQAAAEQGQ